MTNAGRYEIRSPKPEIRRKSEGRNPKMAIAQVAALLSLRLFLRASDFGFPSDFGFRASGLDSL
jgi:hypothetical protein